MSSLNIIPMSLPTNKFFLKVKKIKELIIYFLKSKKRKIKDLEKWFSQTENNSVEEKLQEFRKKEIKLDLSNIDLSNEQLENIIKYLVLTGLSKVVETLDLSGNKNISKFPLIYGEDFPFLDRIYKPSQISEKQVEENLIDFSTYLLI